MAKKNLFEQIPGADFEIVCTKSENKSIRVHSYLFWSYSDVISTNFEARYFHGMNTDAKIEDVVHLMNILYNMNFKDTGRTNRCVGEYDDIPMRLYYLAKELKIKRLEDPLVYEKDAKADVGDWKDVKNISQTATNAINWISEHMKRCTSEALAVFYVNRMAKILAMYSITTVTDEHRDYGGAGVGSKLLDTSTMFLKMIASHQNECVLELRKTKQINLIVFPWWYTFLLHYSQIKKNAIDEMKPILESSSFCMLKIHALSGCGIYYKQNGSDLETHISVSSLVDENMTIQEMIQHDLRVGSLVSYVGGKMTIDGNRLIIDFPLIGDGGATVTQIFTAESDEDRRKLTSFAYLVSSIKAN